MTRGKARRARNGCTCPDCTSVRARQIGWRPEAAVCMVPDCSAHTLRPEFADIKTYSPQGHGLCGRHREEIQRRGVVHLAYSSWSIRPAGNAPKHHLGRTE